MTGFLDPKYLTQGGPRVLTRSLVRLLRHLRFEEVFEIDGPGDMGGDVLASRNGKSWVFQSKWKSRPLATVGADAVDEVLRARDYYASEHAAIVTNARGSRPLLELLEQNRKAELDVPLWDGRLLLTLAAGADPRCAKVSLYDYQRGAFESVVKDLADKDRSLLVMATGLGKTVVAGEVVAHMLLNKPDARVLVVAHTQDLADQLERALWSHLELGVRTQLAMAGFSFDNYPGVTFATLPTALSLSEKGYRAELVVIDEAHHIGESGQYARLLEVHESAKVLGVTATPWRGDGYDIANALGSASARVGIEDGMRLGYLAAVRYRMFADNVDWDFVRAASKHAYTLKDLNARLFLPGRDDAIVEELAKTWATTRHPRAIVFCRTIEHAERMAKMLQGRPGWQHAASLHADLTKRERQMRLLRFRSGEVPILTAVDILNEGVDVPDVNILCFARVTHSRRIFVQQLGRGLRVRRGKDRVEVLDFVSDIRRVAEVLEIRGQSRAGGLETLTNASRNAIGFTDQRAGALLEEWIQDAASLATRADEHRLQFPAGSD